MTTVRAIFLAYLFMVSAATAQDVVLERVRIEVVRTQRQYDDDTRVTAFQGEKLPIVEFEAEFEDGGDVIGISLQFPNSPIVLENSERDGDIFRLMDFVASTNISLFRGVYVLTVEPRQGDDIVYEFEVDFDLTEDFPEVRFPIDGVDRVDYQSLDAEWDAFADSYRLDLFDFPLAGFHRTFRTTSEDFDLGAEVDRDEAYELWIGSTEEETGDTEGDFDVEVWFTSSAVLFFSTGPRSRNQLPEFNSSEIIASATVINRVKRIGQTTPGFEQEFIAQVIGNRLFDIETARIRGEDDGRLDNDFVRLDPVVPREVFERKVNAKPGDDYLFLVEFLEYFGSEVSEVPSTLSDFPTIVSPLSNASGLGSEVTVEWDWSGPAVVRYEVSIQEIGDSTETDRVIVPGDQSRVVDLSGLADNRDYRLQISALTEVGAESIVCIFVNTGVAGDANRDGEVNGKDLFAEALVWHSNLPGGQTTPTTTSLSHLDLNGDEWVNANDLVLLLAKIR